MYDGLVELAVGGFELCGCEDEWGRVLEEVHVKCATAAGVAEDQRVLAHGGTAHRPSDEYLSDILEDEGESRTFQRPFFCCRLT